MKTESRSILLQRTAIEIELQYLRHANQATVKEE